MKEDDDDWRLVNGVWIRPVKTYDAVPVKSKVVVKGFGLEGRR